MVVQPKPKRNLPARDMYKGKVLQILKGNPLPFNEISRRTKIWPAMLTSILGDLVKNKKLEQVPHEGRLAYKITKKGIKTIVDLGILGVEATEIMQKGGIYHDDYSGIFSNTAIVYELPWGIQDDICYDRNLSKTLPISNDTAKEVHKTLYNCIKNEVKQKKISLDSTKDGTVIFGLTINYANLVKSINEQSLYYVDNISKEEIEFFDKIGDRGLSSSEKIKLDGMRKRTKTKIGVKLR
jgi:hypothetical protein